MTQQVSEVNICDSRRVCGETDLVVHNSGRRVRACRVMRSGETWRAETRRDSGEAHLSMSVESAPVAQTTRGRY